MVYDQSMSSLLNFRNAVLRRSKTAVFPDQQQTEEYLSTLSPRAARSFRKFVALEASNGHNPTYSGVLAARLFVQSLNWETVDLESSSFSHRLSQLSAPGIIDLFEQFSTDSQESLWKHDFALDGFATNCTTEAYFSLLIRTGLPAKFCSSLIEEYYLERDGDPSKARTHLTVFFWNAAENRWRPHVPNNLEIAEPSRKFSNTLIDVFQNKYKTMTRIDDAYKYKEIPVNFGTKATESSVMLSVLYGEQVVMELLLSATESKVNMCLHDAISVLDAWKKKPEYPIEWILHTVHGQHNHSAWKDQVWHLL